MCLCVFRYCHQLLTCDIDTCCTHLLQSLTQRHSASSQCSNSYLHRPVSHSLILCSRLVAAIQTWIAKALQMGRELKIQKKSAFYFISFFSEKMHCWNVSRKRKLCDNWFSHYRSLCPTGIL